MICGLPLKTVNCATWCTWTFPISGKIYAYRGLSIVGRAAVVLTFFIVVPFVVMGIIAAPHIQPRNWLSYDLKTVQWGTFINVMFW